jgi:pimeloyl-ACP methyl ester carboxylesterase
LAFASLYPAHTKALILQGGVTQPFSDVKYVPELFRAEYMTAFKKFGWTGDQVSQVIFGLLVTLREKFLTDEEFVKALTGERLAEAREEPAFGAVTARMLREDAANRGGEGNDVRNVFFSKAPYCRWETITAPALIVHDEKDVFVPIVHAEEAKSRLRNATLRKFALAGHIIWLGREARLMHETRVEFLRRYS